MYVIISLSPCCSRFTNTLLGDVTKGRNCRNCPRAVLTFYAARPQFPSILSGLAEKSGRTQNCNSKREQIRLRTAGFWGTRCFDPYQLQIIPIRVPFPQVSSVQNPVSSL